MIRPVKPLWKDQTCVILAGGPSLLKSHYNEAFAKKLPVIAINDSWRLIPIETWLDHKFKPVLYFCDKVWWDKSIAMNPRSLDYTTSFHDVIYKHWITGSPDSAFADHPQVDQIQLTKQTGLDTDPTKLCHGSNSGHQALNLAFHLGATRIILIGYDMKIQGARGHWHDNETQNPQAFQDIMTKSMLPHFDDIAEKLQERNIRVYNANKDSSLTAFPRFDGFDEALKYSDPTQHKYEEPSGDLDGCMFCGQDEENHAVI